MTLAGLALDVDGVLLDRKGVAESATLAAVRVVLQHLPIVWISGEPTDAVRAKLTALQVGGEVKGENGGPPGSRQTVQPLDERAAKAMVTDSRPEQGRSLAFPLLRMPGLWAVETTPVDIDKGVALTAWASKRGLSPSAIWSVGDNVPDIAMFGVAGRSFAMGHAPEDVRAAADVELPSVEDKGLLYFIERYVMPQLEEQRSASSDVGGARP